MGYDLHITRAEAWYDSESAPITREEWEAFAHGRLPVGGWATLHDGTRRPIFACTAAGVEVSLDWHADVITIAGATLEAAQGLRWIADALDARLVGDDGEAY